MTCRFVRSIPDGVDGGHQRLDSLHRVGPQASSLLSTRATSSNLATMRRTSPPVRRCYPRPQGRPLGRPTRPERGHHQAAADRIYADIAEPRIWRGRVRAACGKDFDGGTERGRRTVGHIIHCDCVLLAAILCERDGTTCIDVLEIVRRRNGTWMTVSRPHHPLTVPPTVTGGAARRQPKTLTRWLTITPLVAARRCLLRAPGGQRQTAM